MGSSEASNKNKLWTDAVTTPRGVTKNTPPKKANLHSMTLILKWAPDSAWEKELERPSLRAAIDPKY